MKKPYAIKQFLLILSALFVLTAVQAQTPVASYLLDGNGDDASGSNDLSTFAVSYGSDIEGVSNQAMKFNGSSSYAEVPSSVISPGFSAFRLSLWFKTAKKGGGLAFAGAETVGAYVTNYTPLLYIDTFGHLNTFLYDGSVIPVTSPDTVNDNQWHHALVAYDINLTSFALTQSLFLDGIMVDSKSGIIGGTPSTAHIYLGACCARGIGFVPDGWMYFDGLIDEVNMYTDVLTYATWENLMFRLTSIPASQTVDSGAAVNFNITHTNFLSSAVSYAWLKNGSYLSDSSASLSIASALLTDSGSYMVEVSNSYGKTLQSKVAVLSVNDTSELIISGMDSKQEYGLNMYPNPSTDFIQIHSEKDLLFEICDLSGKQLLQSQTNNLCSIQSLSSGNYLVRIYTGDRIISRSLVKQ